MKIYTHVRIDMVTGREVFAKGYDYEGPFAFAAGNTVPIHGKVTRIAYGTAPATVMDFTDGWSIDVTLDVADASRLGQNWKEILPGQAGWSGSFSGQLVLANTQQKAVFDTIVTASPGTLFDASGATALSFLLEDNTDYFTGDLYVTGFSTAPGIGDTVKFTVNFQGTGALGLTSA